MMNPSEIIGFVAIKDIDCIRKQSLDVIEDWIDSTANDYPNLIYELHYLPA